ncbi:hypothetical protein EVAR_79641_1 [Eumeta japonica]|uniref:Protein takeout n=1 Tax=Eumeta variegata TaxID=151549 RepID=A0A4C1W9S3_EUMVA|nr:hypothetical protein EVAR_79641_1 [Eumeta japonica]
MFVVTLSRYGFTSRPVRAAFAQRTAAAGQIRHLIDAAIKALSTNIDRFIGDNTGPTSRSVYFKLHGLTTICKMAHENSNVHNFSRGAVSIRNLGKTRHAASSLYITVDSPSPQFPDFRLSIDKCHLTDPTCLKLTAQKLLPELINGGYGMALMDPMKISHVRFQLAGLTADITETTVRGLRKSVVDKLRFDTKKREMHLTSHGDLTISGRYRAGGRLLILPITGDGEIHLKMMLVEIPIEEDSIIIAVRNTVADDVIVDRINHDDGCMSQTLEIEVKEAFISFYAALNHGKADLAKQLTTLENMRLNVTTAYELAGAPGAETLSLSGYKYVYDVVGNAHFNLTNLFNGNKKLSEVMLNFMNMNWKQITEEFGGPLVEAATKEVYENIRNFLKKQPLREIALIDNE